MVKESSSSALKATRKGKGAKSSNSHVKPAAILMAPSEMRLNSKSDKTRGDYIGHLKRFVSFLEEMEGIDKVQYLNDTVAKDDYIRRVQLPVPDVVFDAYLQKICYYTDKDGALQMRKKSTPDGFWSAFSYVYKQRRTEPVCNGGDPPSLLRARFKDYVEGLKRRHAKDAAVYGAEAEGKEAFTQKAMLFIQKAAIDNVYTSKERRRFAPLVGVSALVLGCRIFYACRVSFPNLRWKGDRIVWHLRSDKEDPGGERVIERPIHSNPSQPFFDFFLFLGIRVMCCPGASNSAYIVGDENSTIHSKDYDSKVQIARYDDGDDDDGHAANEVVILTVLSSAITVCTYRTTPMAHGCAMRSQKLNS